MNRPDALYWRNTNQLSSLEFVPGRLAHHRVPRWVASILVAQCGLGTGAWLALQSPLVQYWLGLGLGQRWAEYVSGVGSGGSAALSFALSQAAVMLLLLLTTIPLLRRGLRHHTAGLRDLFEAIRSMSTGVVPKPLMAGRPGEIGFLALAFNDMIARLLANRKELIEANQSLERRVAARTQELREAAEKMEKMARIDALTGLANRRALMDEGDAKFSSAVRDGADIVCLLIDLDNFKGVNDTLGHAKGDEIIRAAADSIRRCCRPHDIVARLGGDEFVVIMALDDIGPAATIAQRLQEDFRTQATSLLAGSALKKMPSMSIGITSRKTARANTLEQLMAHADTALYQAKDQGKARTHIYRGAA
ncbi:MAG TPA: diguanylate cyclase [Tepidisphaeraceae bacterium]|nr:diguanylate cyclase [Tepidisphaeraceae bacterium]